MCPMYVLPMCYFKVGLGSGTLAKTCHAGALLLLRPLLEQFAHPLELQRRQSLLLDEMR